jgi:Cu/Ag efflux pump CusA
MTSASTTFGALPLLLASGAGAESRQPIGIVVVFGVAVSAVLTLVAVPALYSVVARKTKSPQHVARMIARLRHPEETSPGHLHPRS